MRYLKILFCIVFSHICILGVFWDEDKSFYVVEKERNLCGEFTIWDKASPNWLPDNWQAIFLDNALQESFLWDIICETLWVDACCKSQWYRYAGIPIGVEFISWERKSAEFLAGKGIIEKNSFNPSAYNLEENISRKEVMKIIIGLSDLEIQNECKGIFTDVENDWACKYIESALESDYIVWDGPFRPNENITRTEALKLIFKAKNIEKAYTTEFWEEDYISTAYYYSYIDEKYSNYSQAATRWWIFSVAWKTYEDFKNY